MTSNSTRRALVVIDVQNEYINGNFRIEYPPVSSSLPKIEKAMDAAKEAGVPIVVVQHVLPPEAPIFAEGSEGVKVYPSISAKPYDLLVTKTLPSCFTGTELKEWLDRNSIDTLTIVGYMTHNCDDSTTREAMHRGYQVEVLSDATGSLPYSNQAGSASAEQIHKTTLVVMQSTFAAVMSTDDWMAALKDEYAPVRDNIFLSNQRAVGTPLSLL